MRRVVAALTVLALCAAASGEEPSERAHALVEVVSSKSTYYVNEPILLTLRIGIDQDRFARYAVPLFHHRTEWPVQVQSPWSVEPPGVVVLPVSEEPVGARRTSLVLDEAVARPILAGDRSVEGRTHAVAEVSRRWVATGPGTLVIPSPALRYSVASRFETDVLGGRVAVDPKDVFVKGSPLDLRIEPLPEEGRPAEFQDAVGRFSTTASVDRPEVEVGRTFRLRLTIEGEGNLEVLSAPRLDHLRGFHVYGMLDDRGSRRRTIDYDVAPLGTEVAEVPAIPFAFFDPGPPAGYRVVRTEPLRLVVREPASPPPGTRAGPREESPVPAAPPVWPFVLVPAVVAALGIVWFLRRRRAGVHTPYVHGGAGYRERAKTDVADAFTVYLADRLACPKAAVVSPGLAARLESVGVPSDLARRAATTLEELVAVRYGGSPVAPGAVSALVEELDALR